jgi:N-acetylglutamate synthase-like GNAT family acetyltransferase
MKQSDIKTAASIVGQNYSSSYQRLARKEMKAMFIKGVYVPVYMVAEEGGKVIACAGYIQSWMDYNIYHIFWVNVAPAYQRQGIGQLLVKRVLDYIKKKDAALVLLTTKTPKFYNRLGFKKLFKFRWTDHLMVLRLK